MKTLKLKFYPDAGHGWLAVKRKLLKELNILDKITGYSYERGQTVYLEEDQDADTLWKTMIEKKIKFEIIHPDTWPDHSPIRSYNYFHITDTEKAECVFGVTV